MSGVSRKHPTHAPNEANNYSGELINKGFVPDSLPGCLGYCTKTMKCRLCKYRIICLKVLPREECIKLLQEILNEIEETKKVLKF